MGMEYRNGRAYYYRKRREGGRVVSEYVGGGIVAQMAAEDAAENAARREAWRATVRAQNEVERVIDGNWRAVLALMCHVIMAAGYRQHKGEWRKVRDMESKVVHSSIGQGFTDDEVALMKRINGDKPKAADVEAYRQLLQRNPNAWRVHGNLELFARRLAVSALNFGKSSTAVSESMIEGESQIRDAMGYQGAPMMERLLIEHIVTCWLRMQVVELTYSNTIYSNGGVSLAQGAYWERKLEATQRRYLRAIEALAKVRRLKLPTMQVNVAQAGANQLNMAASGPA